MKRLGVLLFSLDASPPQGTPQQSIRLPKQFRVTVNDLTNARGVY